MSLRPSQKAILLNESERKRPSRCWERVYRSLAAEKKECVGESREWHETRAHRDRRLLPLLWKCSSVHVRAAAGGSLPPRPVTSPSPHAKHHGPGQQLQQQQ